MNGKGSITKITIILVGLSLLGLLFIQFRWLQKTLETNRAIFQERINLASQQFAEVYRNKDKYTQGIHKAILNNETAYIDSEITKIIDETFLENAIKTDYTYGIYTHANSGINTMVAGNSESTVLDNSECNATDTYYYSWVNLTCRGNYGKGNSYHLAIFPSYNSYVFNEVKWSLLLSLLCIGIILAGFIFALKTIARQRKLSELKNDFINNLTHEFKTPLFSINLASKSIRKLGNAENSTKTESYLDVIDTETNHLKSQVEKILQLAMLDAEKLHLEKTKIDLNEELRQVTKNLHHRAKEYNGELLLDLTPEPLYVYADSLHIRNAWYNLIDNALKYSDRAPKIEISTSNIDNEWAEIRFSDNGYGISKENRSLIFERFYRESKGNIYRNKGSGLGLSYVKKILELHEAIIELIKSNNEGSEFLVRFPVSV